MSPDSLSLAGKVALVTGSGRENGIGAAIARALARNGAHVAIHYVSQESKVRAEKVAESLAKDYGTKTVVVQGAVQDPGAARRMVKETLTAFSAPHLDILVNNAAAGYPKSLSEVTPEQIQHEFSVIAFGTIYMIQAALEVGGMPVGGRIINIGSTATKQGPYGAPVYVAAKAAQDCIAVAWAGELGRNRGITINTLAPGLVPTDMSKPLLETSEGVPSGAQAAIVAATRAAARLGTPEDLADAVLLLVSEKSRWITAEWISVSGGLTPTM
ncbi:putative short-chain dehydrogenase [Stachybotrys elegans]|uniref:Short-chain dehydrogenase n=1 Tax=Stachybotrys elegans TaxID=80388 RepID=A0A8K0SW20_9HYPO|nr:putative short-chain dehydrogenase [Stachybotrys elegans]